MASLIPEDGVLVEVAETAQSPSKDFWQLKVTCDEVRIIAFRVTCISLFAEDIGDSCLNATHETSFARPASWVAALLTSC